jgi:hypothetical protein
MLIVMSLLFPLLCILCFTSVDLGMLILMSLMFPLLCILCFTSVDLGMLIVMLLLFPLISILHVCFTSVKTNDISLHQIVSHVTGQLLRQMISDFIRLFLM